MNEQKYMTNDFLLSLQLNDSNTQVKKEDFEVLSSLGMGSFSRVYKVKHKYTTIIYAMKQINKFYIDRQNLKNYVLQEIKIMSQLKHKNIAQLYYCFEDDQNIYLILEYAEYGNLQRLIVTRKLDKNEIKNYMRQIVNAVNYCHNKIPPIIHRDLKTENILICNNKILKLTDFGCSAFLEGIRTTQCGTMQYTAPEIFQKQQQSNKVDVWSIGIIMYQMIFQEMPFKINRDLETEKEKFDDLKQQILQTDIPRIEELQEDEKNNPEKRISCNELLNEKYFKQKETEIPKNQNKKYDIFNNQQKVKQIKKSESFYSKLKRFFTGEKLQEEQLAEKVQREIKSMNQIEDIPVQKDWTFIKKNSNQFNKKFEYFFCFIL